MNQEELNEKLRLHKLWLNTTRKEGARADLREAYLRGANLEGADLREAYLIGANLYGAYLRGAYLRGANLIGANLIGADLYGTYLRGADLIGADLYGANLIGADLSHTEVFTFSLGKHSGFYHTGDQYEGGDYLHIGCEGHSLQHWLENYKSIGKANEYTSKSVKRYGSFIKWLKEEL